MTRHRRDRWRTIAAHILGILILAIGLVLLAWWELGRTCIRWATSSGHKICAEYR
jgi:hypothetical protein